MEERIIWLAVNNKTGEVDYGYVEYDIRERPEDDQEEFALIDGWSWHPFKLVQVDA
jgi:hypothetical protein